MLFFRIREILYQTYGIKPQKQGEHFRICKQLIEIMNREDLFQYVKTLVDQRYFSLQTMIRNYR